MTAPKIYIMAAALLLVSCRSDKEGGPMLRAGDEVEFLGCVSDKGEVRTRSLVKTDIKYDPFDMDFYIELCCFDDKNAAGPPV